MSSDNNETRHVQIAVADPTPLGLFGLSVVTFVASGCGQRCFVGHSLGTGLRFICSTARRLFRFLPQEYFWSINLRRIRLFLVGRSDELDD